MSARLAQRLTQRLAESVDYNALNAWGHERAIEAHDGAMRRVLEDQWRNWRREQVGPGVTRCPRDTDLDSQRHGLGFGQIGQR